MPKIMDDLRCAVCNKKLSKKQRLFDTAWSGVYWCGGSKCAETLLLNECKEFDTADKCTHEDW